MNRSQYNKCVELYADGLFRFVLTSIRIREKAEDIVQDTFAKVWEHVDEVEWERSKSYLFTTAYHTMIDSIRKEQRTQLVDDPDALRSDTAWQNPTGLYPDVQHILHKALKTLPEIQRTVVLLRDYEGYSYEEIGNITGLGESQVKVYIFRARTALKKQLKSIDNLIDIAS